VTARACIVIAAGGTGGHVFPGLALADALRDADVETVFVGTARGFESKLVPAAGYAIELFDVQAIKGGGASQAARGSLSAARALGRALHFVRARAPKVVVSIGGYAAGPVSLAAAMLGVPVAIIEPNSVMGLSNRLLAPLAQRIYLAFDAARPTLAGQKIRLSGVPLRSGFGPRRSLTSAASATRRVLVLGGSQGAQALNERLPQALGRVQADGAGAALSPLEVLHQAGEGRDREVREAYAREKITGARVVPFSDNLANDLAWADVVVARAGAGTIAEIAAVGRASLLIPFPHAADDHQAKNAAAYAGTGAAVWLRQEAADSTRIASEIGRILGDESLRERLARNAAAQGRPEAARTIGRDLLKLIEVR
jgi:UDP-N-acetylglucosamine--N-acetylmuramyl-(pentapeptide) pyrophosphoryl-undecaprenol N-acetylglucosamine transferase